MFADYRVPQALEYFGVLEYSDDLQEKLRRREPMHPGHRYDLIIGEFSLSESEHFCSFLLHLNRMELEIRATSIEATERLVSAVKEAALQMQNCSELQLATVNAITVDNFFWDYSRAHREKTETLPFHLVRTIFY